MIDTDALRAAAERMGYRPLADAADEIDRLTEIVRRRDDIVNTRPALCECGALIAAGAGVQVKTSGNISGRAWRCPSCSDVEIARVRTVNQKIRTRHDGAA